MLKRLIFILLAFAVFACGYSEDEWQAQLNKYNQVNGELQRERQTHAATRAELEKTQQRVAALVKQLEDLGVNMDQLNEQLQREGTVKAQLQSDLEQTRLALEEYKRRAAQLEAIRARFENLKTKLDQLTRLGLKVVVRNNRMVIQLPGDVLFSSGKSKLEPGGIEVLSKVADVIRSDKELSTRYFQVAGHTDNKPLKGGKFEDNWGLSAERAREVLVFLVSPPSGKKGGGGLNRNLWHAAGYADTDPIESNDTDGGRKSNRRVELVLMPNVEEMLDLRKMI